MIPLISPMESNTSSSFDSSAAAHRWVPRSCARVAVPETVLTQPVSRTDAAIRQPQRRMPGSPYRIKSSRYCDRRLGKCVRHPSIPGASELVTRRPTFCSIRSATPTRPVGRRDLLTSVISTSTTQSAATPSARWVIEPASLHHHRRDHACRRRSRRRPCSSLRTVFGLLQHQRLPVAAVPLVGRCGEKRLRVSRGGEPDRRRRSPSPDGPSADPPAHDWLATAITGLA